MPKRDLLLGIYCLHPNRPFHNQSSSSVDTYLPGVKTDLNLFTRYSITGCNL